MGQIKIIASDKVLEDFKKIVLVKHGKLELSVEGEEALKMYIKKYEYLLKKLIPPEKDPLKDIIGMVRSKEKHNVLQELEMLERGEY
jgi:hypothetical protein